jgi:general secretion pathway protein G
MEIARGLGVQLHSAQSEHMRRTPSASCSPIAVPAIPPTAFADRVGWQRNAGFTLIELLVVVVIIGLLAGFVAPRYFGQIGKANVSVARAQIESLGKALDQYRIDVGSYPSTDQGLQALVVKPDGVDRWQGPYLQKQVPPDPWNRPYRYKAPGDHADYDLSSYGADGQPGGSGENTDISSWELFTTGKAR